MEQWLVITMFVVASMISMVLWFLATKTDGPVINMPKQFPLHKVVEVHWNDACSMSGWRDISQYRTHKPSSVVSVGYLLKKTKKVVTLVMTQGEEDDCNGAMAIPVPWITKYRVLRG